jgi:hypothetical protein
VLRKLLVLFFFFKYLAKISSMWMEMQQVGKEQVWDAERGFYGQHVDANHPPQRVLSSGAANSYTALLRRNKHFILDKCAPPNAGFKVFTPYISFQKNF